MPFTARVERLFRQHGIRVVAIFPDGHVGQPRSRHIRSTRKDETTTEHLTGARGPGDETKRLIADRLEATGDANLGLDREVGARHRGETSHGSATALLPGLTRASAVALHEPE